MGPGGYILSKFPLNKFSISLSFPVHFQDLCNPSLSIFYVHNPLNQDARLHPPPPAPELSRSSETHSLPHPPRGEARQRKRPQRPRRTARAVPPGRLRRQLGIQHRAHNGASLQVRYLLPSFLSAPLLKAPTNPSRRFPSTPLRHRRTSRGRPGSGRRRLL